MLLVVVIFLLAILTIAYRKRGIQIKELQAKVFDLGNKVRIAKENHKAKVQLLRNEQEYNLTEKTEFYETQLQSLQQKRHYLEAQALTHDAQIREYETRLQSLQQKCHHLETQVQTLDVQKREDEGQVNTLQKQNQSLENQVKILAEDKERVSREDWLARLPIIAYRGELEVEIKLIYPLVSFLGYKENEITIRHDVEVQVGRQGVKGEADWVLWSNDNGKRQAVVIIEAKAPSQTLDQIVQAQARSYAFALNAPVYALTNGREFHIYCRGVQNDICKVKCSIDRLAQEWSTIYSLMKPQNPEIDVS